MRCLEAGPYLHQHLGGGEARVDGLQEARDLGRRDFAGLVAAGAVGHRPKAEIGPIDEGVLVEPVRRAGMRCRAGAEAAAAGRVLIDAVVGHHEGSVQAIANSAGGSAAPQSSSMRAAKRLPSGRAVAVSRRAATRGPPSVHQAARPGTGSGAAAGASLAMKASWMRCSRSAGARSWSSASRPACSAAARKDVIAPTDGAQSSGAVAAIVNGE